MAAQPEPTRDEQLKAIYSNKDYQFFYGVLGGLFLVVLGVFIGWQIFPPNKIIDYNINLWNTLIGTGITIFVLDRRAEYREEKRRIKELKVQLVRDAGSQSNEAAKRAIDELRAHGWLEGSEGLLRQESLVGANLQGANLHLANLQEANLTATNLQGANLVGTDLQKANLTGANLQEATLVGADLQEANLFGANLQEATLWSANFQEADLSLANLQKADLSRAKLQKANLTEANLQEADLLGADLQEATLVGADLQGAKLPLANLQEADLEKAQFDTSTRLPNGRYWVTSSDLMRFTDPDHPMFWRTDELIFSDLNV